MRQVVPDIVATLVRGMNRDLGTPLTQILTDLVMAGKWKEVVSLRTDPRSYQSALTYYRDVVAVSLLRKCRGLPTGVDTAKAAVDTWWAAERQCYRTNQRLTPYLPFYRNLQTEREVRVLEFLEDVKRLIGSWIGYTPPLVLKGRFGPGATYSDKSRYCLVPDKISNRPTLTPRLAEHSISMSAWNDTLWFAHMVNRGVLPQFVRGNRFTTVPKTALTDRGIAVEPSVNVFTQLGAGRVLRQRLLNRTGWDLRRAKEIHMRVACDASKHRDRATLDLSTASDTVAYNLVKLLLPRRWFLLLDRLRSPTTEIEGKTVVLEKFSSMGNGFTFELETIIFAALACVCAQRHGRPGRLGSDVFVFGDDIIVDDDLAPQMKAVLEFCGFTLNGEKSFFGSVPFRESCGGDYFNGCPVRPYFMGEIPEQPQELISCANGIRRVSDAFLAMDEPPLLKTWFGVLDRIPVLVRSCRGPSELGDIVIHDDPASWTMRVRSSIRYLRVFKPNKTIVVWSERSDHDELCWDSRAVLAAVLSGAQRKLGRPVLVNRVLVRFGGFVPRDAVLSYRVGWVPYS